jgi:hypothetical protein
VGKKRASLSDKLEALTHQDERTAAGLVIVVAALEPASEASRS